MSFRSFWPLAGNRPTMTYGQPEKLRNIRGLMTRKCCYLRVGSRRVWTRGTGRSVGRTEWSGDPCAEWGGALGGEVTRSVRIIRHGGCGVLPGWGS